MTGFVVTANRLKKAKKIEAVLKDFFHKADIENQRVLDIGCGSGLISEYFAKNNKVYCVDIEDHLLLPKGETVLFKKMDSERIPFEEKYFDIVISNHVIEHIKEQNLHLKEIRRVLKTGGVCYLATPNRNFPVEPHYKVPFINYFSNEVFHRVLKIVGKYKEDLFLLKYSSMIQLFEANDFDYFEYTNIILRRPSEFFLEKQFTRFIPLFFLDVIKTCSPTNIFVLRKTL